jgi:hypothetical protein
LQLRYTSETGRLFPLVYDPGGQLRGVTMRVQGNLERSLQLQIAQDQATPGSLPGPLPPGTWEVWLDAAGLVPATPYQLQLHGDRSERPLAQEVPFPEPVLKAEPGWYRGELHTHTLHSDGNSSVAELVSAAQHFGLDFLVLTDHFTTSGWRELAQWARQGPVALIRGMELTSHRGHANLIGIERPVDIRVDDPARPLSATVEETHRAGGLFSVNHPFSNVLGWQRHDLDWAQADLMEIYHHLEFQHNVLQWGLWDQLLGQGYRVVGVGATDSHQAFWGRHRLGQVFTYVAAPELSAPGILSGLRSGRVFVSLGPTLEFQAASGGKTAQMWESLPLGGRVELRAQLRGLDRPATLFVLKNGLYLAHRDFPPGDHVWEGSDLCAQPSYYRIELHAQPYQAPSPHQRFRSWDSFMAASNPVLVGAHFKSGRWK